MGGVLKMNDLKNKSKNKELFTSFGEMDNSIVDPKNFSFGESDKEDSLTNDNNSANKQKYKIYDGRKILNRNSNSKSDQNFSFHVDEETKINKKTNYYLFKQTNINEVFETYTINKEDLVDFKEFLLQKYPKYFIEKIPNPNKEIEVKEISPFNKYSNRFKLMISCYCERRPSKYILKGKYLVENLIDESTFSYIYIVSDYYQKNSAKNLFIAKKIKEKSIYFDQSIYEIYILSYLLKRGNCQKYNIVEIQDYFYYNSNLYIITEKLGKSLYEAFIKPKFPLSLSGIQTITRDILFGLKFLKNSGIIHCDLKPENILLVRDESNHVKIIDFGSAIFIDDTDLYKELQTLPYRAPEIIIGSSFNYAIDMWSLGCILYELVTHTMLFNSKNPKENFIKAMTINNFFDLNCFDKYSEGFLTEDFFVTLNANFNQDSYDIILPVKNFKIEEEIEKFHQDKLLIDFIKKCLIIDPKIRLTPENARTHPFMKKKYNY
jgi:serine/threonine protein kinase